MGNKSIEVIDIIDRWLAPDHRYFKVLGEDSSIYILRQDVAGWKWDLAFFSHTQTPVHMEKPAGTS